MTILDPLKRFGSLTVGVLLAAAIIFSSMLVLTGEARADWSGTETHSPTSAYSNQTVEFHFELTNTGDSTLTITKATYEIDWGDSIMKVTLAGDFTVDEGGTTDLTGSFTTPDVAPGTYAGNLSITARGWLLDIPTAEAYPANFTIDEVPELTVSVQASPAAGAVPLEVKFNSSVTGGIGPYTYEWSTGDGSAAQSSSFDHQYAEAGKYNATLVVSDSRGSSAVASVTVTVTAFVDQLVATIQSTMSNGMAPLTTTLSSTVSGGIGPYTYSWTTGDGGTFTGGSFTYEYQEAGTYTVRLLVTDSNGNTARDLITIIVLSESDQTIDPIVGAPLEIGSVLIVYIFVFVVASVTVVGFMIYRNRTRFRR